MFCELMAFISDVPVSVLDRVLSEIRIVTDDVGERAEIFFGSSLPTVLELQTVIHSHSERYFFDSEVAFARVLLNLREARTLASSGTSCALESKLDAFESDAIMWWLLRMGRHLIRPFRAHSSAHGEKVRDILTAGVQALTTKGSCRFTSRLALSKIVYLWWNEFKRGMEIPRDESSDEEDEEDDKKLSGTGNVQNSAAKRLDGLLNYHEFETLLCASGGASLGCDRVKMHMLFDALDCCGGGKVSTLEIAEVSETLRRVCHKVKAKVNNRKMTMEDVRWDIIRQFKTMSHKHSVPVKGELVKFYSEKSRSWVSGRVEDICFGPDGEQGQNKTKQLQGSITVRTDRGLEKNLPFSDVLRIDGDEI